MTNSEKRKLKGKSLLDFVLEINVLSRRQGKVNNVMKLKLQEDRVHHLAHLHNTLIAGD